MRIRTSFPYEIREIENCLATGETIYTNVMDRDESGEVRVYRLDAIGLETGHGITERFTIKDGDRCQA